MNITRLEYIPDSITEHNDTTKQYKFLKMEIKIAIGILQTHNRWRRGEDLEPMTNPTDLGIAIDTVVEHFKNNVMCDCEDKDYSNPEIIQKKCFQCKKKIEKVN